MGNGDNQQTKVHPLHHHGTLLRYISKLELDIWSGLESGNVLLINKGWKMRIFEYGTDIVGISQCTCSKEKACVVGAPKFLAWLIYMGDSYWSANNESVIKVIKSCLSQFGRE